MEIVKYFFESFWRWVGFFLTISVIMGCLTQISLVRIEHHIHNHGSKEDKKVKEEPSILKRI